MTAKEFDLILLESFEQEAKQSFFKAKRRQYKCNPDEYFAGLINSFKRLKEEVNKTDYLFAIVTTPEGEEREYFMSSDSHSEQMIFLQTIGKVSFPNKRPIDLKTYTNGQFNGKLTVELMVKLWPDLQKYCQSIIDKKTEIQSEIPDHKQVIENIFVPKIKQFLEYLNPDNQDELAEKLKNEFKGKKGKTIAIMILALEKTKNICYQSRTELYESIGLYFDCKLNESGINRYLNESGKERKLLLESGKIEQIIDKLKLNSS
ncbi:MAG: hypothetical protein Q8T08_06455 [Ignavibacteria bacterium]|nr:hypothetical protein [Ignavibacteria bacterium]